MERPSLNNPSYASPHPIKYIGGEIRRIHLPNGYKISLINGKAAHAYPFAWEAAMIGPDGALNYDTPLTTDVMVFDTDEETQAFIDKAFEWAEANQ